MRKIFLALLLSFFVSHTGRADLDDEIDVEKPQPSAVPTVAPAPRIPNTEKPSAKGDKGVKTPDGEASKPKESGSKGAATEKGQEPVKFQSAGLTGFKEQGTMELTKDVIITQGDTKMEADNVKAFYDNKTKELVKIVATGRVKLFKDDPDPTKKARSTSNEAVFYNKERRVVLKGNPQLIRAGGDVVKGKEITYELDTGWVKVDRVEGVLMPQNEQSTGAKSKPVESPTPSRKK